jgi:hypothetical protein
MINKNEQKAQELEEKTRRLIVEYQKIKDENTALKAELEKSLNDLKLAHHDNVVLQTNFDQFRTAKALSGGCSETETAEQKEKLLKLVREIDKCLNLLNKTDI